MTDFSSKKSAYYLRNKFGGKNKPVVFLTFDDGPEAGTKEVYKILSDLNTPATFFFVGERAVQYENIEKGFFKKLYEDTNIQIGNHSQTHGHEFIPVYYKKGLRVHKKTLQPDAWDKRPGARRSVLMDFEYANVTFTSLLMKQTLNRPNYLPNFKGKLDKNKINYYGRFLIARLPGQNMWHLDSVQSAPLFSHATDEAKQLYKNGYKIFGWDLEWKMRFEVHDEKIKEYKTNPKEPIEKRDGYLNLYSNKYIALDRPLKSGEETFKTVKSEFNKFFPDVKKKNKLILLMHDRAFRLYKKGQEAKYSNYLKKFIELCKKEGYDFDILENY